MLFPMAPHISAELSSRLETHDMARRRRAGQRVEERSLTNSVGEGHGSWPQLSETELALLQRSLSCLRVVVQVKGVKLGVLEVEAQVAEERDALVRAVMDSPLGKRAMGAEEQDQCEEPKRVVVVNNKKGGYYLVNIVP